MSTFLAIVAGILLIQIIWVLREKINFERDMRIIRAKMRARKWDVMLSIERTRREEENKNQIYLH